MPMDRPHPSIRRREYVIPCRASEEDFRDPSGAVGTRGQGLAVRSELHRADRSGVRLERLHLVPDRHIPELDHPATIAAGERLAVGEWSRARTLST